MPAQSSGWGWRPSDAAVSWLPSGDAAYVDGVWWALNTTPPTTDNEAVPPSFPYGDIVDSAAADLDGDGYVEYLVSYRHPRREILWDPLPQEVDAEGRTAHLGVVDAAGSAVWLAHRVPHPVVAVAACGAGTIAIAYATIGDDRVIAVTAATWNGFGFTLAPELTGPATVGCADVDGDGTREPVVVRG
jgi:hypothetical protein